ncbi:MAG: beta-ketoacyl-ACP synthase II [Bdellovibrionaceae bacterium]|nr:beta-ketoacyl-ACP synthase II [Pseudobdellovibrionaceae bacterium]
MTSRYERAPRAPKRVVVTGIGAVSPLGLTLQETWENALKGKSGVGPISKFNTEGFDVTFAGEVKGFKADLYIDKKEQKKMDTFIHYSMAAAKMALDMAKLEITETLADRAGTIVGAGMGGLPMIEEQFTRLMEKGPGRISPFFIPSVITNLASGQISIAHGLRGVNYSVTSACATGVHSLGEAVSYIRQDLADVMLAGGTEATVCKLAIGGFAAMRALSTRNEDPETASRPWDQDRDGFVLGEGAAVFCLESMEYAEKRGAHIICEVTGYGTSADAYHMTSPAPGGTGGRRAMELALRDASLKPSEINYINAHATSTPMGDTLEIAAIKALFQEDAGKVWISGTKSMTGHLLGAAGALESAFCALAIRDQIVPPTINLKNPSEGCNLDFVPNQAREGRIHHVLNNSFGFGGTNGSLIFSKL